MKKTFLTLVLTLGAVPSTAAQESNTTPPSGKTERSSQGKGTTLKGSVSMVDIAAPTSQPQWDANVLPKLKIGAKLLGEANTSPEGVWYRVPEWTAGTWDVKYDKPDQWHKDSTERIGRVRDRNGDIWSYCRGMIMARPWEEGTDKECTVVNIMGASVPQPSRNGSFDLGRRDISISHRKDNSIIRLLVTVEKAKYVRLSNGQLHEECSMEHLVNHGFDGVSPSLIWFRTWRKLKPFEQDESMVENFCSYLQSHNMSELIPTGKKPAT